MIHAFTSIFLTVLGACLGSFANVVAIRLHEMSSLGGRSHCPACKKTLRPRHLIPIFSWLMLRGRCADCGAKIHIQYPLVELTMAILFAIIAYRYVPTSANIIPMLFEAIVSFGIVVMVVMDLRWKELPLEWMIALSVLGFVYQIWTAVTSGASISTMLVALFFALAVPILFFGAQWLLSKGQWLGSGDIWFGVMMAFILGTWQLTALSIYFAYIAGGLVVVFLFLIKRIKRGMRIPFAPALATGLLLAMWFGPQVLAKLSYVFF